MFGIIVYVFVLKTRDSSFHLGKSVSCVGYWHMFSQIFMITYKVVTTPCLLKEKTEAQRSERTGLRLCSSYVVRLGFSYICLIQATSSTPLHFSNIQHAPLHINQCLLLLMILISTNRFSIYYIFT